MHPKLLEVPVKTGLSQNLVKLLPRLFDLTQLWCMGRGDLPGRLAVADHFPEYKDQASKKQKTCRESYPFIQTHVPLPSV